MRAMTPLRALTRHSDVYIDVVGRAGIPHTMHWQHAQLFALLRVKSSCVRI